MSQENSIRILISSGQQIVVNADLVFDVEEKEDIDHIHISDVLYAVILKKLRDQPEAVLTKGTYRVNLTVALSDVTEDDI